MKNQAEWVHDTLAKAKQELKFVKRSIKGLKSRKAKQTLKQLHSAHDEVFSKIDCLDCANCCRNISPTFNSSDRSRISKFLGMKQGDFEDQYLKVDGDEDFVLKQSPCAFLMEDHSCSIYEVRPKDCQRYPYTDDVEAVQLLSQTEKNALFCPAVYRVLQHINAM